MYVVGLFAQVTYAPELISKSVQSEIARSTHMVGVLTCKVKRKRKQRLIKCVSNQEVQKFM